MTLDAQTLYQLLPAVHRNRDAENGGALLALIQVIAQQIAVLEDNLAQLYDDQFIETCADWVVPYIGDLVGYRQLNGVTPRISSPRAEVADTIALRRGKGTAATLEKLARDVTGWDVHVVEMMRRLATTAAMSRIRPDAAVFADLRDPTPLEAVGGAFDPASHNAEVRNADIGRGWYNIGNVVLFLWRLQACPATAPARQVDAQRFLFSPHGAPLQLFSAPAPKDPTALATAPWNVGQPLTRLGLAADTARYYGPGGSLFVQGAPLSAVAVCNLSDAAAGAWAHTPAAGAVAIDPVLGRLAFGTAPASPPMVTYHYGFSSDLGGGGYDRASTFQNLSPGVTVPGQQATIQAALNAAATGGTVEVSDSGRYAETLTIALTAPGALIELRAADLMAPFVALGGDFAISGADSAEVTINGLWIDGGRLHVAPDAANKLTRLTLRHCTLTPGISLNPDGSAAQPDAPSLVIETGLDVVIDHCILGGIRVAPGATVTITNSILDAGRPEGVAYAAVDGASGGAPLSLSGCTVIGKVHAAQLPLVSNAIVLAALGAADTWPSPVWADMRSTGCARFSYLPPGARAPRPYCCQPTTDADPRVMQPVFTSQRFGDPGYCQLSDRTPREIREGSEDRSEMGVFQDLSNPQKETNLRLRLREYLRFGLDAALVYVT